MNDKVSKQNPMPSSHSLQILDIKVLLFLFGGVFDRLLERVSLYLHYLSLDNDICRQRPAQVVVLESDNIWLFSGYLVPNLSLSS